MDMSTNSVQLPKFGGDHKYSQVWWMRFTSYSAVYGFSLSVQKTKYPVFKSGEDTVTNLATAEGKKQEKAKNMNSIAITNLTMAFTSESLIGIVYK